MSTTNVAVDCSEARPHEPHVYYSFIAGGSAGPVPTLMCVCPGVAVPTTCPTCGPTDAEQHPRRTGVVRCVNCKEWLA